MRLILLILAAAGLAAPALAQTAAPVSVPSGDPVHGKQVYMAVGCYQCHGTAGEGGRTVPRLGPNPIGYQFFVNQLHAPVQRMPVYTAVVLPEQSVADIYAYLKTVPATKKVADIPLLNR